MVNEFDLWKAKFFVLFTLYCFNHHFQRNRRIKILSYLDNVKYLECRTVQYYKFFYTFVTGYIKITVLWKFNSSDVEHLTRQILLFSKKKTLRF